MKLTFHRVTAQNFRGVTAPVSLSFTDVPAGLYFIRGVNEVEPKLGANGAGKTTVFIDAILWALVGRTAKSQRPGDTIETWGAAKGDTTSVTLEFLLDDIPYVIHRSRNPNTLTLNGEKVEQDAIDRVFPLAEPVLRRSIIIDQFSEMFLSLRPEPQSRIFSDTLNLDLWVRAAEQATDNAAVTQKSIDRLTSGLAEKQGALAEARDQREAAVAGEQRFEDEQAAKLAEARQKRAAAAQERDEAETALNNARDRLAALGDGATDLKVMEEELKRSRRTTAEAKARSDGLVAALDREAGRLERQLNAYSNPDDKVCPECGQTVTDEHIANKKSELIMEAEDVVARSDDANATSAAQAAVLQDLDNRLEALVGQNRDFNTQQNVVSLAATNSITANRAVHQWDDRVNELLKETNPFTKQADQLDERITSLREDVTKLQEQLADLNEDLEAYKFWNRGYREIRLEQIDRTLLELEMTTNKHAEALGCDGWEIAFATERETRRGTVQHSFSTFLYPPGQNAPVSWDSYSGGESQRWELATVFGLAEVLLGRAGVNPDIEVIDEPTHHLSPEGVEDLLQCLSDRARDLGRKIFVIDHHALDRGAFDGVVTVTRDKQHGVYISECTVPNLLGVWREPAPAVERVRL